MHAIMPSACMPLSPCSSLPTCRRIRCGATQLWTPAVPQHRPKAQQRRSSGCSAFRCQASSAIPAARSAETALGSEAWAEFASAASGEWSGIAVTYNAYGEAQEIPYQYVPDAFREWNMVPKDWHTQCSCLADGTGLLTKLKRLMPIVGCEADAVAFIEDERRALSSEPDAAGEAKTVLRDGSYSIGPRLLRGQNTARIEHCLVKEAGHRARVVFNMKRGGEGEPWKLATLEQHVERRQGAYQGGATLEACGYSMSAVTDQSAPTEEQLAGSWVVVSQEAFTLDEHDHFCPASDVPPDRLHLAEGALLLPGSMWAACASNAQGVTLKAGWLLDDGECRAACRTFADDRLSAMTFTHLREKAEF